MYNELGEMIKMKIINRKYVIDTKENKEFLEELTKSLLAFGRRFPSPGGSSYYLGDDGTPWKDKSRETWITCRMAHVYSIGCLLGYKDSTDLVMQAINGLKEELHDTVNALDACQWFLVSPA